MLGFIVGYLVGASEVTPKDVAQALNMPGNELFVLGALVVAVMLMSVRVVVRGSKRGL